MANVLKQKFITVREAADQRGISIQRMHVLLDRYNIEKHQVNSQLQVIEKKDLEKIPSQEDRIKAGQEKRRANLSKNK